ncbi:hypothetical protein N665_0157s0122 [Sinapis alba]|nr:hypothetical protein N665_0157s0122 [Sinapis alba]
MIQFYSIKGKTKHKLWMELCELLVHHANVISGLNVDAIIRGGIRKFTDEVGMLWTSLADYYIRKSLLEKARDVYEEGMMKVVTVRDFSVIFDVYSRFEESTVAKKMEMMSSSDDEEEDEDEDEVDVRLNFSLSVNPQRPGEYESHFRQGRSGEVRRRVAADVNEPVQMKLHRSLRLWSFYLDLEESLGMLESTRTVYEKILDMRLATPQIILNYAFLLEENKYFEDAFKVYERGVKIFKYPHVEDIWVTYLIKFVKRYGKAKLERERELFEHAVSMAPSDAVRTLYLQYAKLEEDYGLAKRAMKIFGVPRTREKVGLPHKDVKIMCIKFAELERSLGEIDRSRAVYKYASQYADPRSLLLCLEDLPERERKKKLGKAVRTVQLRLLER